MAFLGLALPVSSRAVDSLTSTSAVCISLCCTVKSSAHGCSKRLDGCGLVGCIGWQVRSAAQHPVARVGLDGRGDRRAACRQPLHAGAHVHQCLYATFIALQRPLGPSMPVRHLHCLATALGSINACAPPFIALQRPLGPRCVAVSPFHRFSRTFLFYWVVSLLGCVLPCSA